MLGAKGLLDYLHALGIVRDVQYVTLPRDASGTASPNTYTLPRAVPDFNNTFLVENGVQYDVGDTSVGRFLYDYAFALTDAQTITYSRGATNDSSRVTNVCVITLAPNVLRGPVQRGSITISNGNASATYPCAPIVGPMRVLMRTGQFGDTGTDGLGALGNLSINTNGDTVTLTRAGTNLATTCKFQILDFLV